MTRDPMNDEAYDDFSNKTFALEAQVDDLKALVRDQAAEIERRTLRHAQHVGAFQEVAKDNERLGVEITRLRETAHSDRTKLFEENRAPATARIDQALSTTPSTTDWRELAEGRERVLAIIARYHTALADSPKSFYSQVRSVIEDARAAGLLKEVK